jgi:glycerophosphoryl diester phosphodiesterase
MSHASPTLLALATSTAMSTVPPLHAPSTLQRIWRSRRWLAHRGAGRLAPENTLAAFRTGARLGCTAFECDVKLSADGVAFLMHDATLERTTGKTGIAGDRPWAELSRLDAGRWHSAAFTGEPIPTLATIARFCIDTGSLLNIEIKPTPGREVDTGERVAAEAARLWRGQPSAPLLSSFSPAALAAAREAAPELPRALLLEALASGWFEQAQMMGCAAVVAHHPLFDAAMVERLHAACMLAMSYTVNDAAVAERLFGWGVDALITDAVDRLPACQAVDSRFNSDSRR